MSETAAALVHIHLISLRQTAAQLGEGGALALLSPAERAALANAKAASRRQELLYGRAALRRVLAHHTALAAEQIQLHPTPQGKPRAYTPAGHPLPPFNLAHTGDLLAIALGRGRAEVGVDLEQPHSRLETDIDPIAQRHFTSAERAQLAAAGGPQKMAAFLRIWTLKEAVLKAAGSGLLAPLASVEVGVADHLIRCIQPGGDQPRQFIAHHRPLADGWHLAVAREGALRGVVLRGVAAL